MGPVSNVALIDTLLLYGLPDFLVHTWYTGTCHDSACGQKRKARTRTGIISVSLVLKTKIIVDAYQREGNSILCGLPSIVLLIATTYQVYSSTWQVSIILLLILKNNNITELCAVPGPGGVLMCIPTMD